MAILLLFHFVCGDRSGIRCFSASSTPKEAIWDADPADDIYALTIHV
jgi:hypothetical protein